MGIIIVSIYNVVLRIKWKYTYTYIYYLFIYSHEKFLVHVKYFVLVTLPSWFLLVLWGLVSLRAGTHSFSVIWPGTIPPSFSQAFFLLPSPPSMSLDFFKSPEELLTSGFWFLVLQYQAKSREEGITILKGEWLVVENVKHTLRVQ